MSKSTVMTNTTSSLTTRLQSELAHLMMNSAPGISLFPVSDADMFKWVGSIDGPPDSLYDELSFKVAITFPRTYPFEPPLLVFMDKVWHPNVDNMGHICLDILKDKWSAVYDIQTVLISLQSLLEEPNPLSPLNGHAAKLWEEDKVAYRERVLTWLTRPCDLPTVNLQN